MSPKSDDLEILIYKYRTMDIEELKAILDSWDKNTDCTFEQQKFKIAKNELEFKHTERQEQIKLLTKSLSSSSRVKRWISSIRAILS